MNPTIPVSWGELIDKITILEIKAERLTSDAARECQCTARTCSLLKLAAVPRRTGIRVSRNSNSKCSSRR